MRVAIIGCGVTGLSTGITLQKAGINTVIFEKTNKPGGVIAVYKKNILANNALEFVYGTAQNTFANDMWQSVGMFRTSPELQNCFKTFLWNNHSVGIYKDFNKTVKQLLELSPEDEKQILRFAKSVRKFGRIELPLLTKASENTAKRLIMLLINWFSVIPDILYYGTTSCNNYSKRMKSPELRTFFSEILNKDRSALQYIVLWAFFASGKFSTPDNNQQEMIESLYNMYTDNAGEVKFKSELINVKIEDNKICELNFADRRESGFDYVIFSNDLSTIDKIMKSSGKNFPVLERITKKEHITSSCTLYFKADCPSDYNLPDNISIPCTPFKAGSRMVNNFSVRIQNNTPADYKIYSVTLYQNEKDFLQWKKLYDAGKQEYEKEKLRVAESISASIEEYFPDIHGKLLLCDISTPLTYHRFTGANYGGWMPESWNPAIYLLFGKGHMPGIKNASIAGQKIFPFGGTTLGAYSGIKLAEQIIKKYNKQNL